MNKELIRLQLRQLERALDTGLSFKAAYLIIFSDMPTYTFIIELLGLLDPQEETDLKSIETLLNNIKNTL